MINEIKTGPQVVREGSTVTARGGNSAEAIVQDAHARYHEPNYRGGIFTFGITNTALATANAIATGVTSTAQPVIGLWNPSTSLVNLVVIKAIAVTTSVANTAVAPGGFMWMVSTGQSAITTGSTPFSCKTLAQSGSSAKAFAMSTALTGLSGSLVACRPSSIGSINAAGQATAIPDGVSGGCEELLDGMFIVPPGGVLALMNQLSTTTVSVNAGIIWEEILI